MNAQRKPFTVALVCDFFWPALGGVETHIRKLASFLSTQITRVIVITHQYDKFLGKIEIEEGVTVYYLPLPYSKSLNIIFMTYFFQFAQAKRILLQQKVDIVHCHQAGSTLALEYSIYAKILGLKLVHTEHSLYGYRSMANLHLNAVLNHMFPHYDRIICVSRAVRNNVLLRSSIHPDKTIIIPNSVVVPVCQKMEKYDKITILVVGRLVYRRGIDLLIQILPQLCRRNPNVSIKIIGDGPKAKPLRFIIARQKLSSQVQMLGPLKNEQTLEIMSKCHIFLNTAITQSFGIALVEAASLGLRCVSTFVGGISETLPPSALKTAPPIPLALILQVEQCLQQNFTTERVKFVGYNEKDCSQRVVEVYEELMKKPKLTRGQFLRKVLQRRQIPLVLILIILLILIGIEQTLEIWRSRREWTRRIIAQIKRD